MKIISVVRMLVPWLLLLAVTSCGTTSGYNDFAGGGIGGTGISVGKITASTGTSVAVNGVTFDINNASVTVDGSAGNQTNLKVGMIVKVNGTFNADGTTGVAATVEFKDNLEGPVDSVEPLGTGDSIVVLGQTVIVDSTTYFDDFLDLDSNGTVEVTDFMNQITTGNVVEVSGFVDADGVIHASYISLKAETIGSDGHEIEVKGTIIYDTNTGIFTIGNLTIDFSSPELEAIAVNAANNVLYVEVKSNSAPINNVLIATSIEIEDEDHDADEGERIEVEGFVTDVTGVVPDISFVVKGHAIQASADTIVENGNLTDIKQDTKVEVKGSVDVYGFLIADKIEIESANNGSHENSGTNDSVSDTDVDSDGDSGDSGNGDDEV